MRAKFFFIIAIRVLIIQTMGKHQYTYYYSLVVASPCVKKSQRLWWTKIYGFGQMEWVNALVSTLVFHAKGGGVEGLWLLAFDVFVFPNKFEVKLSYYIFWWMKLFPLVREFNNLSTHPKPLARNFLCLLGGHIIIFMNISPTKEEAYCLW